MVLKFIVTSDNPAKINAVKSSLLKFHNKDDFIVSSFPAESSVSSLPKSDDESICGCKNRIDFVLNNSKYLKDISYVVGVEGGLDIRSEGMFISTWIVIFDLNSKKYSYGCSPKIMLPPFSYNSISKGEHLTQALRCIADCDDFKRKNGAFGILTKDLITRSDSSNIAFMCAYSVFHNSELFFK